MSFAGIPQQQPQGYFGSMGSASSFTSPPLDPKALQALTMLENSAPTPVTAGAMAPSMMSQAPAASPPAQPSAPAAPNQAQIQAALLQLKATNPMKFQALMQAIRARMQAAQAPGNSMMSAPAA